MSKRVHDTKRKERPMTNERKWLLSVLAKAGIKKIEFAQRVGINDTTLTALCNGSRALSDYYISKICKVFDVPPPTGHIKPLDMPGRSEFQLLKDEFEALQKEFNYLRFEVETLKAFLFQRNFTEKDGKSTR